MGRVNVSSKTEIIGSIGTVDPDSDASLGVVNAEGTGYMLGAFYTVLPKTQVYTTYSAASLGADGMDDPSILSIGVTHKFGFGS